MFGQQKVHNIGSKMSGIMLFLGQVISMVSTVMMILAIVVSPAVSKSEYYPQSDKSTICVYPVHNILHCCNTRSLGRGGKIDSSL